MKTTTPTLKEHNIENNIRNKNIAHALRGRTNTFRLVDENGNRVDSNLCAMHEKAIMMRKHNREQHANRFGQFDSEEAAARDKELEREISIFGQVHNPRISAKAYRALNHTI